MSKFDMILWGMVGAAVGALAYEVYQFNKPTYRPAILVDMPDEYPAIVQDVYLLDVLERYLGANPA